MIVTRIWKAGVAEITAASTEAAAALKAAERRLAEMAVLIKNVTTCKELRPLVQEYQRAADKKSSSGVSMKVL